MLRCATLINGYVQRVICAPSVSRHSTERIALPYKYYMNWIVCSSSFINNLNRLLFINIVIPLTVRFQNESTYISMLWTKGNLDFKIIYLFCLITCLRNQVNINERQIVRFHLKINMFPLKFNSTRNVYYSGWNNNFTSFYLHLPLIHPWTR